MFKAFEDEDDDFWLQAVNGASAARNAPAPFKLAGNSVKEFNDFIKKIVDFMKALKIDEALYREKFEKYKDWENFNNMTPERTADFPIAYKSLTPNASITLNRTSTGSRLKAEFTKEIKQLRGKVSKVKSQRNAVLKGAGIDNDFSTEGSQSNTWNSEKEEETVKKVAGVVEKKVEDAAAKAKAREREGRIEEHKKRKTENKAAQKTAEKLQGFQRMAGLNSNDSDFEKRPDTISSLQFTSQGISLVDGGGAEGEGGGDGEKPAFKLKAWDMVEGFVTYMICKDGEQPKGLKGGQGIVKKADANSGPDKLYFAIKAALNPSRHRQKDEAAIYFKLDPTNEPHLAFLSDVVMRQGQPLLVLEWANKGSLGDWLKVKRELPMKMILPKKSCDGLAFAIGAGANRIFLQALEYAIQIVRGLRTLHSENDESNAIVHQDLKPGNVLNYDSVLKVADFGLSFAEDGEDDHSGGSGTRGYMAPEQMLARLKKRSEREGLAEDALADLKIIDGESSKVSTACDIWAFGLIVAQMIGEGADTAALEYIQASRRDDLQEVAKEAGSAVTMLFESVADEVEAMDESKEKNALLGVVGMLKGCLAVDASKRPSAKECVETLQEAYKELKGEKFKKISASTKREIDRDIFSVFPQSRVRTAWFHRQVTGDMGAAVGLLREELKEEVERLIKTTGNAKSSGKKKKQGSAGGSGGENKELRKKVREALNLEVAMVDAVLAEYSGWLPSVICSQRIVFWTYIFFCVVAPAEVIVNYWWYDKEGTYLTPPALNFFLDYAWLFLHLSIVASKIVGDLSPTSPRTGLLSFIFLPVVMVSLCCSIGMGMIQRIGATVGIKAPSALAKAHASLKPDTEAGVQPGKLKYIVA
ncbi:hypothetical protein TrLO_g7089 [Triparma laevis f. longispina]|uniref:Protein kinase domain-containing protein n=1 Tax=Triparma laevis f. longispina TaxID=1714387 RepID=A0A9W7FQ83_9STRA|nr:hypothetical protein TrLO_g7089 [Triparma laevis f. longispina]